MPSEYQQGVVAYVLSTDATRHMEWMKNVFGAVEKFMYRSEDGKLVAHAVVALNGGCLYITDLSYEMAVKAINDMSVGSTAAVQNGVGDSVVAAGGPRGFILHVELEDPKDAWKKALESGCTVLMDLKVQSWGCLYGLFRDPYGFAWAVASPTEGRKRGVVPYILTPGGECLKQIEWLKEVFGGQLKESYIDDNGTTVNHCGVEINGYTIYMADQTMNEAEKSLNGKPSYFHCHLEFPNPQAVWETAMKKGAQTIVELKKQFWGELQGTLEDPFGSRWSLSPICTGPTNSPGVIAYLHSPDCQQHIDFITKVFDGKVKAIYHTEKEKKIMHCSMEVNGGELCLCDQLCCEENADWPKRGEACGFMCHLDLSDPDVIWKKAMDNGCKKVIELKQQFWGDYYGVFQDPLGYGWSLRKEQ